MSHDMEDLLKRASANYPLKQADDKWDEIASRLNTPALPVKTKRSFSKTGMVIIFILLVMVTGSLYLVYEKRSPLPGTLPVSAEANNEPANNNTANSKSTDHDNVIKNTMITAPSGIHSNPQTSINKQHIPQYTQNYFKAPVLFKSEIENTKNEFSNQLMYDESITETSIIIRPDHKTSAIQLPDGHIAIDRLFTAEIRSQHALTNLLKQRKATVPGIINYNKGFYYGGITGLHVNTIKDQSFKKASYQLGVIAGYNFNRSFSIESGIIFSEKYYHSPARYFDMEEMKQTMPAGMEMINIRGSSKIIEIPLHLHYKISLNQKDRMITSAGVSSFIMAEENNEYLIRLNGAESKMQGLYKNNRKYAAATLDIGIGYEKQIGNNNYLGVQPLIQLPLKGIGLGDLPVKSAGIRLRYIHNLR